jgi:hypothetical protein
MALLIGMQFFIQSKEPTSSSELHLSIANDSLVWDSTKSVVSLNLKALNTSKKKLRLFCFYDEVKNFIVDEDFFYEMPGFNLALFDRFRNRIMPELLLINTHGTENDSSRNQIMSQGEQPLSIEAWEYQERERILSNEITLSSGDSVEIVLTVDFGSIIMDNGVYELQVYYIINDKIFEYVDRHQAIFTGVVRSNKVRLVKR